MTVIFPVILKDTSMWQRDLLIQCTFAVSKNSYLIRLTNRLQLKKKYYENMKKITNTNS